MRKLKLVKKSNATNKVKNMANLQKKIVDER